MKFLASLAIIALATVGCTLGAPTRDPGAWLAQELGLDSDYKAAEALHRFGESKSQVPISPEQRQRQQQQAPQEPLTLAQCESQINELSAKVKSDSNPVLANQLARAYYYKVAALRAENRFVEAIVEAEKLRQVCINHNGCPTVMADNLVRQLDGEMMQLGHYAVLGLNSPASRDELKRARKKLALLLHPDKNGNLDAQGQAYLRDVFVRVQASYDQLMTIAI